MALVKMDKVPADPVGAPVLARGHLIEQLQSTDVGERRAAVRGLASLPNSMVLLYEHLALENNNNVRSLVFVELINHKSFAIAGDLLCLLASEDANLRGGAIEALQEMPDEMAPHVESMLVDPDSDVRIGVVAILAALRHPKVPIWLQEVIERDPHVNVCAAAIDALAEVGEPQAIPALIALAERFPDVAFVQFAVAAARRRILGR
jgi:HEAT repeat protein